MNKKWEMKNEWGISDFENCLEKVNYTNKIQRKDFKEQGNFPIISQEQEFVNGYWDDEKDLFRIEKPVVIFGDHTKVIKYVDFDFVLGADGVKILKTKKHIIPKYLYYYLQNIELENLGYARHYRLLKEKMIEYPKSLPEQHRIVSILDECFSAIEHSRKNVEQNLKNAKELFESFLQGVFGSAGSPTEENREGWIEKCLDELGTITSSKRIYKSEYVKDGVPFYRTKEIKEISNGKPISLELFISNARYNEIKKTFGVPQIGDLLLSAVGTIGEIMVVDNEDEFYFKDGNIVWFKGFKSLDANYLKYALSAFVEKIKSLAIGAAYNALTIERLNKYKVSFPKSIPEQQRIVRQLDALRTATKKLEAIYQKKIANLDELKKSILDRAFKGEF